MKVFVMFKPKIEVGPLPPADVAELFHQVLSPDEVRSMDILFDIRATCQQVDSTVRMWLGPDALSPSRMHVMMVLWAAKRPVPQMHVVSALKVSRATVSNLIEALQKAGHVTSVSDTDDRRNTLVALTPAGEELTRRMTKSNAARLLDTLQDLAASEQEELLRLLALVRTSFRKHEHDALHFPALPTN